MKIDWTRLLTCLLIPLSVGAVSGVISGGGMDSFGSMVKPPLSPPGWLFPIVWTISKGAPADQTHTLVTYLYQLSFTDGKGGHAAAVSVIGFVILAACASVYMIMSLRGEEEE